MKSKIIFWTFILIFLKGFSQIHQSPNKFNSIGLKDGKWILLYDGTWNEVNNVDSAKYYRDITFLNGKPKGKVRDYYLSGKVLREGKLKSVDPDIFDNGIQKYFFENGKTKYSIKVRKSKLIFEGIRNGQTLENLLGFEFERQMHNVDIDNTKGKLIVFYPNGMKRSDGSFINGKKEGLWIYRFENGKKSSKGKYKNNLKEGEWKVYGTDRKYLGIQKYKYGIKQNN